MNEAAPYTQACPAAGVEAEASARTQTGECSRAASIQRGEAKEMDFNRTWLPPSLKREHLKLGAMPFVERYPNTKQKKLLPESLLYAAALKVVVRGKL